MQAGEAPQPSQSSAVNDELDRLNLRIGEVAADADRPERLDVLRDLEVAYESLRAAGDEIRSQQEHLDGLLELQVLAVAQHARVAALLPVAVVTTDEGGRIQEANPESAELLGVPSSEIIRETVFTYIDPNDRAAVRTALQGLPEQGSFHRCIRVQTRSQGALAVDAYAARDHVSARSSVTWVLMPSAVANGREGLARALVSLTRLSAVVESAEDLLPAAAQICQAALGETVSISLMVGKPTEPQVVASTSALAQSVDGAQVRADEGPSATSHETASTVISEDLHHDERWPAMRQHLSGLTVGGVVAVPVLFDDVVMGALNAFTTPEAPPDAELVRSCELLASSVGSLLYHLRTRGDLQVAANDLRRALSTRAVIDQAKGIIMADKRCSAEEAFQHLVDISSRNHVKLREVASTLVERTSSRGR